MSGEVEWDVSRALSNDDNDALAAARTLPVSAAPHLVTPRGLRLIEQRIESLEEEAAFASGESAEALRRELDYWRARRKVAHVVDYDPHPRKAGFGTRVTIRRDTAFEDVFIVGEDEADPVNGRLAWSTPLARLLDGAERGDSFAFQTGAGTEEILVLAVRHGNPG